MAKIKQTEDDRLVMIIDENTKIEADSYNIILTRRFKNNGPNAKSEYRTEQKFYSTLEACLLALFEKKVIDNSSTANKCLKAIQEAKKELIDAINEAFPSGNTVNKVKSRNTTLSKGK